MYYLNYNYSISRKNFIYNKIKCCFEFDHINDHVNKIVIGHINYPEIDLINDPKIDPINDPVKRKSLKQFLIECIIILFFYINFNIKFSCKLIYSFFSLIKP